MFQKILIANRGEIAMRIIRTCQRMNIGTVAIYSQADAESPHVKTADEAYEVGPAPVNQSYLNMDKILEIAKKSGADGIHPGYGLLSENATFARRCEEIGIRFIGPRPEMIEAMGDKIDARRTMQKAGIPVVPGTTDPVHDAEEACDQAEAIGFPVMLKSSAGGGGIGMQAVYSREQCLQVFEANQKRVKAYFGDGAMYVEKLIEQPRHIEVQILADSHGRIVHLGERECSIQRRHQKVIEEAPSPFLNEKTREQITQAAVRAAQAIGYVNAGTIEFLVDQQQNFYFLEMNTRIQVEHPVTEQVYGVDLIEQQIRIAAGEKLILSQDKLTARGHSIECRIYAEDPDTFYPSPGKITKYQSPQGDGIRLDDGVVEGSVVTPYYDPMLAKLIVDGDTREQAIKRMQQALAQFQIEGIKTNIPLLARIVDHSQFIAGETDTHFIEKTLKK